MNTSQKRLLQFVSSVTNVKNGSGFPLVLEDNFIVFLKERTACHPVAFEIEESKMREEIFITLVKVVCEIFLVLHQNIFPYWWLLFGTFN